MNTAELKLDLFRKIDNLRDSEIEKLYQLIVSLLSASEKYNLSDKEKKAIEEAMEYSKRDDVLKHETVINDARKKYRKLKFK